MKIEINITNMIGKVNFNQKIVALITIIAVGTVFAWMPFCKTGPDEYLITAMIFNIVALLFSGVSWFLRFRDEDSNWMSFPASATLFYVLVTFFVTAVFSIENGWSGWSHGKVFVLHLTFFVLALIIHLVLFVECRNSKISELKNSLSKASPAEKKRICEALLKITREAEESGSSD